MLRSENKKNKTVLHCYKVISKKKKKTDSKSKTGNIHVCQPEWIEENTLLH